MLKLHGDLVDGKMIVPPDVVVCPEEEQDDAEIEDLFVDHGGEG